MSRMIPHLHLRANLSPFRSQSAVPITYICNKENGNCAAENNFRRDSKWNNEKNHAYHSVIVKLNKYWILTVLDY